MLYSSAAGLLVSVGASISARCYGAIQFSCRVPRICWCVNECDMLWVLYSSAAGLPVSVGASISARCYGTVRLQGSRICRCVNEYEVLWLIYSSAAGVPVSEGGSMSVRCYMGAIIDKLLFCSAFYKFLFKCSSMNLFALRIPIGIDLCTNLDKALYW